MILGDYHTHTIYSHGKGNVEQNVIEAKAKGLKQIAITDHSFNHRTFGMKLSKFHSAKEDCRQAADRHGIDVLLGLETNLLDAKGNIDLCGYEDKLDIIICGYHKLVKRGARGVWGFSVPIMLSGLLHKSSKKRIIANTEAFIKAMDKHKIDIISHPGAGIKLDIRELARAAKHFNVLLELNGKRIHLTQGDVDIILEEGADFIINSDAHSINRVGDFSLPLSFIEKTNIPEERIANYNKIPVFRRNIIESI